MIDKEYIKEIVSRITKKKADGHIVPATASMQEIMIVIREDALECMKDHVQREGDRGEQDVEQCFIQMFVAYGRCILFASGCR